MTKPAFDYKISFLALQLKPMDWVQGFIFALKGYFSAIYVFK